MNDTRLRGFTTVTEAPGVRVTAEAVQMLQTRYAVASDYAAGRDVLEVGCGAGMGLGMLARRASRVVGGDYTFDLAAVARSHYRDRVPIAQLDAHALPFLASTFDVVVLYEAIYYLNRPELFLAECRRVLRPDGLVVICTANKERRTFNPSPHSVRYWSASELEALGDDSGFDLRLFGAFPEQTEGAFHRIFDGLQRQATRIGVMPRTMKGKELLKRVFKGPLCELPAELAGSASEAAPLVPLESHESAVRFKVLYAIGTPAANA